VGVESGADMLRAVLCVLMDACAMHVYTFCMRRAATAAARDLALVYCSCWLQLCRMVLGAFATSAIFSNCLL
jgi:hypothetical protein